MTRYAIQSAVLKNLIEDVKQKNIKFTCTEGALLLQDL